MVKSHLRLAKEFQSRSYDALVAHTTVVFARYIMLAMSSREEEDPKTIGQLFYLCCDEMEDLHFAQAFMLILDLLKSTLLEEPVLSEERVQSIIDQLFNKLPRFLKKPFLGNQEFIANVA
ncbi:hypothetical protein MUB24_09485 [Lederbergia sp. NSJ-179]|uniref:hypothetical protein n=1 Tax=Lederbergia sp. NSJ-179 TaxID=2931402 RepID=UPI001FD3DF76|nr:hypothetical protein [Lederbergia sp. NSJ-179]MCJ7841123.1 hypothetical protein [Lederbergia sp. NSJ-179]